MNGQDDNERANFYGRCVDIIKKMMLGSTKRHMFIDGTETLGSNVLKACLKEALRLRGKL